MFISINRNPDNRVNLAFKPLVFQQIDQEVLFGHRFVFLVFFATVEDSEQIGMEMGAHDGGSLQFACFKSLGLYLFQTPLLSDFLESLLGLVQLNR